VWELSAVDCGLCEGVLSRVIVACGATIKSNGTEQKNLATLAYLYLLQNDLVLIQVFVIYTEMSKSYFRFLTCPLTLPFALPFADPPR
jgi:hypothetical protein